MEEVVLFGTGDRGKKLYKIFRHYGIGVKYWIDSDCEKWKKQMEGKDIYPPSKVRDEEDIRICISAVDEAREMYQKVIEYGVPACRIHTFCEAVIDRVSRYVTEDKSDNSTGQKNIILDCSNGLGLGGVESWSMALLKELRQEKYQAYLLAPDGEYGVENSVKKSVIWMELSVDEQLVWENLEYIWRIIVRKLPCVFVSSSVNDALLAACSIKKQYPEKISILSVIHQGLPMVYKEYAELNPYIDKYIAVSRDIQAGMTECGIPGEKILHMTCPVNCIEPYERKYSLSMEEPLRIGYAGRIESEQKRLDRLITLIRKLEALHTNYRMEIAGKGTYLETLAREIKELGLEQKVSLKGEIKKEEIAGFWSGQDICMNLSDFEGRSISVMEAMMNGAVPVVTDTSGVREDIEDGVNGCIVPVGAHTAMAWKIDYLANHRELLERYGERSHEIMMKKGAMDAHMEFWKKLLAEAE